MENYFGVPIIPDNEPKRLQALSNFNLIDFIPNEYFDDLARIVGMTFNAPIALISIVGEQDVYFRGNFGMSGTDSVSRGKSLCSLAILNPEPTVFRDALEEPCLLKNPLVTGTFGLRFYAGAPLITQDGFAIGSVCVVDQVPRVWLETDSNLLARFADVVMLQINTHYQKEIIERLVNS